MTDHFTQTVEAAAAVAAIGAPGYDDPADTDDDAYQPRYSGRCGGCGLPVDPRSLGGSCLWRGGPWHPVCRASDKDRGGTWKAAPRG